MSFHLRRKPLKGVEAPQGSKAHLKLAEVIYDPCHCAAGVDAKLIDVAALHVGTVWKRLTPARERPVTAKDPVRVVVSEDVVRAVTNRRVVPAGPGAAVKVVLAHCGALCCSQHVIFRLRAAR